MNKLPKIRPAHITVILFVLAAVLAGLYVKERSDNAELRTQLRVKSDLLLNLRIATDVSDGVPAPANATKVSLATGAVLPDTIQVSKGSVVTWTNGDYADYTLQSLPGAPEAFKSKTLKVKDTFSYQFDEPGTYKYFVVEKSNTMIGTIIVNE